jgi:hypothetical protein
MDYDKAEKKPLSDDAHYALLLGNQLSAQKRVNRSLQEELDVMRSELQDARSASAEFTGFGELARARLEGVRLKVELARAKLEILHLKAELTRNGLEPEIRPSLPYHRRDANDARNWTWSLPPDAAKDEERRVLEYKARLDEITREMAIIDEQELARSQRINCVCQDDRSLLSWLRTRKTCAYCRARP